MPICRMDTNECQHIHGPSLQGKQQIKSRMPPRLIVTWVRFSSHFGGTIDYLHPFLLNILDREFQSHSTFYNSNKTPGAETSTLHVMQQIALQTHKIRILKHYGLSQHVMQW